MKSSAPSTASSPSSLPSIQVLFREAIARQKVFVLLGINLLPLLLGIIISKTLAPYTSSDDLWLSRSFFVFVLSIGLFALFTWVQTALYYVVLEKEKLGVREAYIKGASILLPFFWVGTLVWFRVFIGFILFIISGVYWLIKYSFANFIVLAENKKGMDALLTSGEYIKGRWWNVFLALFPVLALFYLLSSSLEGITGQVIAFFLHPFVVAYTFVLYSHLKSAKREVSASQESVVTSR